MKKTRSKLNQSKQWVIISLIVLAIIAGVYLVGQRTNLLPEAASPFKLGNKAKVIKSPADLNQTLNDLDSVNLDDMNKELDDNSKDAASF